MRLGMTLLRLCFIVLFGAMSLMHGPVMTFAGAHQATTAQNQHGGDSGHAASDCHDDEAPRAAHGRCNAFACFMAVEPLPAAERPLQPVLFAVMAAVPMTALDPVQTAPALPPPRVQS